MQRNGPAPARRLIALTGSALALLVLLAGSIWMVAFLLSLGRSRTAPEAALGTELVWLLLVVLGVALGGLAVWAANRPRALWALVGAGVAVLSVPLMLARTAANALGRQLPVQGPAPRHLDARYRGGAAVLLIALFVLINGAAVYAAWRWMLRGDPARPSAQEK